MGRRLISASVGVGLMIGGVPAATGCGSPPAAPPAQPSAVTQRGPTPTPEAGATTMVSPADGKPANVEPVLIAAGDIATCSSSSGDEETAQLLDDVAGTVATLGDNAYPDGSSSDFANCYDPTWGRHKGRTRPAAGNHEYHTSAASAYFAYFGAAAGDPAKGYYSYDLGSWHIVVINSECSQIGGCQAGSAQERWLRADLAASTKRCQLAYWHRPLFTSGREHDNATEMRPIFQALYDANAEVVLSGHNHNYERFAPQTPAGELDTGHGIREFVVGTGGAPHYEFGSIKPNSQLRSSDTYGVLTLTLHPSSYDWRFLPQAGKTFTDSGTDPCH